MSKTPAKLTDPTVQTAAAESPTPNEMAPGIPIKWATTHQVVSIPGFLNTEKTLSDQRIKGLKMFLTPFGLLLMAKDRQALIPTANVCVMEPEFNINLKDEK